MNQSIQDWHSEQFPEIFKPFSQKEMETEFQKLIKSPSSLAFIAELEGQAVGYLICITRKRNESAFQYENTFLSIDQIFVNEQHRRSGVGKQLIEAALKAARQQNIKTLILDHWMGNESASNFFKELGFEYFNQRMWRRI